MNLIKSQNSFEKESSIEKDREKEREKRSLSRSKEVHQEEKPVRHKDDRSSTKDDLNFMMQVINKHTAYNLLTGLFTFLEEPGPMRIGKSHMSSNFWF